MQKFDVERLKKRSVRERLWQALDYKREIDDYVSNQSGVTWGNFRQAAVTADTWVEMMFNLANAIDNYENNPAIKRDRKALPSAIADLKAQLSAENDPVNR